jgi:pyruvate formate lyase activating enzyme
VTLVGTTFNIQQFSTEDGPGIRTTIFLKGCPLSCAWCHNPEGMHPQPELVWHDVRCIAARECLRACPVQALTLTPGSLVIDRQACTACGLCAEVCPAGALEVVGQQWTPEALFAEVAKDTVLFQASHGGVTISGGEPLMQVEFVEAFLRLCKGRGEAFTRPANASPLPTALDTCGLAPWAHF